MRDQKLRWAEPSREQGGETKAESAQAGVGADRTSRKGRLPEETVAKGRILRHQLATVRRMVCVKEAIGNG